jgi:tetratricopeptide (TPR) repeat protein
MFNGQEINLEKQRLEGLKQQVTETMERQGPSQVKLIIEQHLALWPDDEKAHFYLSWNYYNQGDFKKAEKTVLRLLPSKDPSIRAGSYLLLGMVKCRVLKSDNPVYFLTEALLIATEMGIHKVAYQAHLHLTFWYSLKKEHALSELHLGRAFELLNTHRLNTSQYYFAEFSRRMSREEYFLAKESAIRMVEESNGFYKPYYILNLIIVLSITKDFDSAEFHIEHVREFFRDQNDMQRLGVVQVIEAAIKHCKDEKHLFSADFAPHLEKDEVLILDKMIESYIQVISRRCS